MTVAGGTTAADVPDPARAPGEVARVYLLVDPADEVECVRELSACHRPESGVIVCHPTPGVIRKARLAADLLVALGKRPDALDVEGQTRWGWELVGVWLRAERVRELVVLRAHLNPAYWLPLDMTGWRKSTLIVLDLAAHVKLAFSPDDPDRTGGEHPRTPPRPAGLSRAPLITSRGPSDAVREQDTEQGEGGHEGRTEAARPGRRLGRSPNGDRPDAAARPVRPAAADDGSAPDPALEMRPGNPAAKPIKGE